MSRSLASKPNTVPAGGDYPYGRIRDNTGSGNGTPVNELVYGDIHQFFERLMAITGGVANGLPENQANSWQYVDALNARIEAYITLLKGGVPAAGDTLLKLYNLITAMGRPRGAWDASSNTVPGSASNEMGDFWRISVAGTLSGLLSGAGAVKPGDVIIANVDGATNQGDFYCIQSNVDQATSSVLGLVKLYTDLAASNTDGGVTQAALNTALALKADLSPLVFRDGNLNIGDNCDGLGAGSVQVLDGTSPNAPTATAGDRWMIVSAIAKHIDSNSISQTATQFSGVGAGDIYYREFTFGGAWSAWTLINT